MYWMRWIQFNLEQRYVISFLLGCYAHLLWLAKCFHINHFLYYIEKLILNVTFSCIQRFTTMYQRKFLIILFNVRFLDRKNSIDMLFFKCKLWRRQVLTLVHFVYEASSLPFELHSLVFNVCFNLWTYFLMYFFLSLKFINAIF